MNTTIESGLVGMNKIKLFLENFLVYGFGGVISKIIPLIMVPIITRLMPDSTYYGISDMSNTIVSLASAFAVMGMYDAMYRMFFEKDDEDYKKDICSTALAFTLCTSGFVFLFMLLARNMIAQLFLGGKQYAYLVYISAMATLVGATNSIISAPTRMQNKRKVFLITNTLSPILSYGISVPLLWNGCYVIALPLAGLISALTMEISFAILNRKWFTFRCFRVDYLKQLLAIAIPLMPNFLIYWLFNSSDRVMITNILGLDATGIYSVGAKLGMASQLIYTAFAGGWQYFAFSTMKEERQVESNSKIFEYLGVVSFICTGFICALSFLIYKLLFIGEYVDGYIISPYLFLAPLLQMLFQVASNQFLVVKKTWPNALILFGGAVVNILLNLLLIPLIGIEGAAIATLLGYAFSDVVCVIVLTKMKLIKLSYKFMVSVGVIVINFVVWRLLAYDNTLQGLLLAMICALLYVCIYRKDVIQFIRLVKK